MKAKSARKCRRARIQQTSSKIADAKQKNIVDNNNNPLDYFDFENIGILLDDFKFNLDFLDEFFPPSPFIETTPANTELPQEPAAEKEPEEKSPPRPKIRTRQIVINWPTRLTRLVIK